MDKKDASERWRYASGALAIPSIAGGVAVLDTHPNWAYFLFSIAAVSVIWGFWPLVFGRKKGNWAEFSESQRSFYDNQIRNIKYIPSTLNEMLVRVRQLSYKQAKQELTKEQIDYIKESLLTISPIHKIYLKKLKELYEKKDQKRFIWLVKWASRWDIGPVYGKRYENFITNFGIILDENGIGLMRLMKKDEHYNELSYGLTERLTLAPKGVEGKARKYERYIYGLCSMSLINAYRLKYIGRSLPISELITTKFNFLGEKLIIQGLRESLLKVIEKQVRKLPCPT